MQLSKFNLWKTKNKYWFFIMSLTFLAVISCSKNLETSSIVTESRQSLALSKELYDQLDVANSISDTLKPGVVVRYFPQWDQAREYQKNDSSHHTVVPVVPMIDQNGVLSPVTLVTDFPFIFVNNRKKFYFGRFFTGDLESGSRINLDSVFVNGNMELTEVFTKKVIKYHYEDGEGVHIKPANSNGLSASRNIKSAYELRCYTENTCTWSALCQGRIYMATSPSGTCITPSSTTDCDYSVAWERSPNITREVCENVWVPDPINPGPGGGGPGPGAQTPKRNLLSTLKLSDCDGVRRANEIANDENIQKAINAIKNKSQEWGSSITLANPKDATSVVVGEVFEGESDRLVNFNQTWDKKNGYGIGFIHNHPNGGAPSPSDIFNASYDIMIAVNQLSLPQDEFSLYLQNFVSIIVSGDYVYTITIADAQKFAYMTERFSERQKLENERYSESVRNYLTKMSLDGSNAQHMRTAGEASLLKLFKGIFNLNKQKIGEKSNNQSVKIDDKGNISQKSPCNP